MDPLAHTLFGACLGEAGLKKASRYAMPTLLIGANAPDVDVLATFVGTDFMYAFRRGWTHGILAVAIWPWVIVGLVWLVHRMRSSPAGDASPTVSWPRLLAVAHVAVASHPLLDWLNNYGVRLLMPFDGTWFYGDTLFIVDPWMWLALGAAVVLSYSRSRFGVAAWSIAALAATGLIVGAPQAPWPAKMVWTTAVGLIIAARIRADPRLDAQRLARRGLAAALTYVVCMVFGSAFARSAAAEHMARKGVDARHVMAGPMPANPFQRDVIVDTGKEYRFLRVDVLADRRFVESHPPVARGGGAVAEAAARAASVRGYVGWLRFPSYTVAPRGNGHRVWIRDVRYSRMRATIGRVYVDLDARGHAIGTSFRGAR